MKRLCVCLLSMAVMAALAGGRCLAYEEPPAEWGPSQSETVMKALGTLSSDKLLAKARETDNVEVLIGLAVLAEDHETRATIAEMAVEANPSLAARMAVLKMPTHSDELDSWADMLIQTDPGNALGHCVKVYLSPRDSTALLLSISKNLPTDLSDVEGKPYGEAVAKEVEGFIGHLTRAAACTRFDTFHGSNGRAALKALDALGLEGKERVLAIYMASERQPDAFRKVRTDFYNIYKSEQVPREEKETIAEALLAIGGQLLSNGHYDAGFVARYCISEAISIKMDLAAGRAPRAVTAYATTYSAVYQDASATTEDDRIRKALSFVVSGQQLERIVLDEPDVSDSSMAKLAGPMRSFNEKADEFLTLAAKYPDWTFGPWLIRGGTSNEISTQRGKVYQLALEVEPRYDRMRKAVLEASKAYATRLRLHALWTHLIQYAYPGKVLPSSEELQEKLGDAAHYSQSIYTGRPYVYPGANLAIPGQTGMKDIVLAYDDHEFLDGTVFVLYGDGRIERMPYDEVKKLVARQGESEVRK